MPTKTQKAKLTINKLLAHYKTWGEDRARPGKRQELNAKDQHTFRTLPAAWFDSEEEKFVVQYAFVHLSFYKEEFAAFLR